MLALPAPEGVPPPSAAQAGGTQKGRDDESAGSQERETGKRHGEFNIKVEEAKVPFAAWVAALATGDDSSSFRWAEMVTSRRSSRWTAVPRMVQKRDRRNASAWKWRSPSVGTRQRATTR